MLHLWSWLRLHNQYTIACNDILYRSIKWIEEAHSVFRKEIPIDFPWLRRDFNTYIFSWVTKVTRNADYTAQQDIAPAHTAITGSGVIEDEHNFLV